MKILGNLLARREPQAYVVIHGLFELAVRVSQLEEWNEE